MSAPTVLLGAGVCLCLGGEWGFIGSMVNCSGSFHVNHDKDVRGVGLTVPPTSKQFGNLAAILIGVITRVINTCVLLL